MVLSPRSRPGTRCSPRLAQPLRSGAPLPCRTGFKGTCLTFLIGCLLEKLGQGRVENETLKIHCSKEFLGKGLIPPLTHPFRETG